MKQHAVVGYEILADAECARPVLDVIRDHHERMDGSGYPNGATAADLGIAPRTVAVADVIDAMTSHRAYRPGLGVEAAHNELRANCGVLYDPEVVKAAMAVTTPAA